MVTDPERLLKKPSSPVAELLMRAGKEEKPSVAVLRRSARAAVAAAALGAATASTSAAATAGGSASAGIGLAVLAKWLGIGALAGVIASPVVHTLVSAPAAQPAAPLRVLATDAPPPPRTQPESMGNRGTPVAVHALEPQPQAVRDVQRVVPQAAASGSSDVVSGTDNALLAAEVELVERGRAALQRGAFQEALRTLAPYEDRFPKQQLLTEVLFLRMESFNRSGDSARARALAARVVTRGITGPQAARAREVLER